MIEPRNRDLYNAVKSYVSTVMGFVASRVENQSPPLNVEEKQRLIHLACQDIFNFPEYQHCLQTLLNDQVIASHLNTPINTGAGAYAGLIAPNLMFMLWELGMYQEHFDFDPERFDEKYASFEAAFYDPYVRCEAIAPLHGLIIEDRSIKLTDDLEISQSSEEERKVGYQIGAIKRYGPRWTDNPFVLRSKYRLPKYVGDETLWQQEGEPEAQAARAANEERIDQVVNALRIYKQGDIFHGGIMHRTSNWLLKGVTAYVSRPMVQGLRPYDLSNDHEIESFLTFWKKFTSEGVSKRKFLEVAIRRFSYSVERHRPEDKIIDMLIAAEALFLSDVKNESYRGELTYRLALRASFFAEVNSVARKKVYQHMRKAYEIRSAIVHGAASLRLPKREDGTPINLEEFVITTEEQIRTALRKAIDLAVQSQTPTDLVDWDSLIFPIENGIER